MLVNPRVITEIRRIRGLSRSQLADEAGRSRPYITQLEEGDRKYPSLETLKDIAAALGIDDVSAFFVEPEIDDLLKELVVAREREQHS